MPAVPLSAITDLKKGLEDGFVAFDVEGYNIGDILSEYISKYIYNFLVRIISMENVKLYLFTTHSKFFV